MGLSFQFRKVSTVIVLVGGLILSACGGEDESANSTAQVSPEIEESGSGELSGNSEVDITITVPVYDPNLPLDTLPQSIPTPYPPETFDPDGDGWMTVDDYIAAIRHLYPNLQFPPGFDVDVEGFVAALKESATERDSWEVYFEYTMLGLAQECSWWMYYLDARSAGNQDAMDYALDVQLNVMPYHLTFSSMKDDMIEMTQKAQLGDDGWVEPFVQNNCQGRWIIRTEATPQATWSRGFSIISSPGANYRVVDVSP